MWRKSECACCFILFYFVLQLKNGGVAKFYSSQCADDAPPVQDLQECLAAGTWSFELGVPQKEPSLFISCEKAKKGWSGWYPGSFIGFNIMNIDPVPRELAAQTTKKLSITEMLCLLTCSRIKFISIPCVFKFGGVNKFSKFFHLCGVYITIFSNWRCVVELPRKQGMQTWNWEALVVNVWWRCGMGLFYVE